MVRSEGVASSEGVVRHADCLSFVVVRTRRPSGQSCQRDRALGSVFSPGRANSLSIQYLISHGKIIIVFARSLEPLALGSDREVDSGRDGNWK